MSFIEKNCEDLGIQQEFTVADTVAMARYLLPGLNRFKLDTVAKAVGVPLDNHHRAVDDAACTAEIFVKFVHMLKERDITDLDRLNEEGAVSENTVRKLPTYPVSYTHLILNYCTEIRLEYFSWLIFFLPLAGAAIVGLYRKLGKSAAKGMNLVFQVGLGEAPGLPVRICLLYTSRCV